MQYIDQTSNFDLVSFIFGNNIIYLMIFGLTNIASTKICKLSKREENAHMHYAVCKISKEKLYNFIKFVVGHIY